MLLSALPAISLSICCALKRWQQRSVPKRQVRSWVERADPLQPPTPILSEWPRSELTWMGGMVDLEAERAYGLPTPKTRHKELLPSSNHSTCAWPTMPPSSIRENRIRLMFDLASWHSCSKPRRGSRMGAPARSTSNKGSTSLGPALRASPVKSSSACARPCIPDSAHRWLSAGCSRDDA